MLGRRRPGPVRPALPPLPFDRRRRRPHLCLRESGRLDCWGEGHWGDAPRGPYYSVSASGAATCARGQAGEVLCRGSVPDPPAGAYRSISTGPAHACAVDEANAVVCWGNRFDSGAAEAPAGRYASVSAGDLHTCARTGSGELVCWGSDANGRTSAPRGPTARSARRVAQLRGER